MLIRKSKVEDVKDIVEIFDQARQYFKDNKIDQWQGFYPDEMEALEDIENNIGYVVTDKGRVIGYFALSFDGEDNYTHLISGNWLNDEPYGVIHRIALRNDYKGKNISNYIYEYCKEQCVNNKIYNLRIDTHQDNNKMLNSIKRFGFIECGITKVEDGGLRIVFQLLFN